MRELREARGLSQTDLAARAGLSRQSLGAIEAGRATPGVDVALCLGRVLGCRVETLFEADEPARVRLSLEPAERSATGRVALAQIDGRWVSHVLEHHGLGSSADALISEAPGSDVHLLRPLSDCRANFVIMGCAPALGLLADRLNARPGPGRFLSFVRGSTRALDALGRHQAHVAGVHLVDGRTGEANVPDVRRHVHGRSVVLITLARWEAGLLVAPGNPRRIRGAGDLARPELRVALREAGSGARRLFDLEAARAGVAFPVAPAQAVHVTGHLEVAHAISIGAADLGIATRDAALAFGLDFISVAEERYDLVVPTEGLDDPRLVRLLDLMVAAPLRHEFASLGYDIGSSGERVAEIHAA